MIWVAVFILMGLSLYIGSKQHDLYYSCITNTSRRLSLKILNNTLAKPLSDKDRREVLYVKRVYIAYLVLFYCTIFYAFYEIYRSAVNY